ncbi:MAG: NUDIX hydrolase [Chitinispirillaceae bacterium]
MAQKQTSRSRSGVFPLIGEGRWAKTVLITSRSAKTWILPKGRVEADMTPQQSALKEALEEAGITGTLLSNAPLGSYTACKSGRKHPIDIYPMAVDEILDNWPEKNIRSRRIVSLNEALTLISNPSLCKIVHRGFAGIHRHQSSRRALPNDQCKNR